MTADSAPDQAVNQRHVVFALATDNGGLRAFPSAAEAMSYCQGVDVEDAMWLFFSDDGSPLEARFDRPNQRGTLSVASGTYRLQRAVSGLWLQERLAQIKSVEGCGLNTVEELVEILKINRGKRISSGPKLG
jgi:hypothetical protein